MELIFSLAVPIVVGLALLIAIGLVVGRLYRRAEKDRAYVRTGLGGQKVVLDGGSLVLPVFQSIRWVNLQTLRLDDGGHVLLVEQRGGEYLVVAADPTLIA